MTRKRSKYRPRNMILDVMGFVKAGLSPVVAHTDADVVVRVHNHAAADAVYNDTATSEDLNALANVSNFSMAFARVGKGVDWASEIRAAADAIEAMQTRRKRWGKVQATAPEKEAISLLVRINDAQLDDSLVVDVEKALVIAKRGVASLQKGVSK